MSFLMPSPPTPPPPPPNPVNLSSPSVLQQGMAERSRLESAEGAGFGDTLKTGGQGVTDVAKTTRSLLGS
jgi:hypothetical protein